MNFKTRYLPLTLFIFFLFMAFQKSFAYEWQGSGELQLKDSNSQNFSALLLTAEADVKITGMLASVTYTQSYKNNSDNWLEGTFEFPLPDGAAVDAMEIAIGDRVIKGEIKERQKARKIYQQAKKSGRRAALTEQHRPNLFHQAVANIGPQQVVRIKLHFMQQVQYKGGKFQWRLPTTYTPRYQPQSFNVQKQEEDFEQSQKPVWEKFSKVDNRTIGDYNSAFTPTFSSSHYQPRIKIKIQLDSGLKLAHINSPYHEIEVVKKNLQQSIHLQHTSTLMDRDFVLNWRPVSSALPQSALFKETINQENYALLMMLPPQLEEAKNLLARDVLFVIDTSGSMGGRSIREAKTSLKTALNLLHPQDRFNVVEFNSDFRTLFTQMSFASDDKLVLAQNWVDRLRANGGTEMFAPLDWSLTQLQNNTDPSRVSQLVFITDGAVGNEHQLFQLIQRKLQKSRLFTVGIGSAPNNYFMRKAAQFGRGSFTRIGDEAEVLTTMTALFEKLSQAVSTGIHIDWPVNSEFYPKRLPDLYLGEPLMVAAKIDALSGDINVSGYQSGQYWQQSLQLEQNQSNSSSGIASLWARQKIQSLQDEKVIGGDTALLNQRITQIALEHHLLSPFTAFVAVEETIARSAEEAMQRQRVSNLQPRGSNMKMIAYPQTAIGLKMWFIISICSFLLILVIRLTRAFADKRIFV